MSQPFKLMPCGPFVMEKQGKGMTQVFPYLLTLTDEIFSLN